MITSLSLGVRQFVRDAISQRVLLICFYVPRSHASVWALHLLFYVPVRK